MNRVALLRRGVALEGVTVGYNALEGVIAIPPVSPPAPWR